MKDLSDVLYSVVIPIYNEEDNLAELTNRLVKTLEQCGRYEIVYVDDGSVDRSGSMIDQFCAENSSIKSITFSRNFGHQAAITAGLAHTSGDVVAVMDGDLQDPPEVLPEFFQKWLAGYQVVYGVRKRRQENWIKKSAYFFFYRLLKVMAEIEMPLDSGDFSAMDRVIVDKLNALPERNRFIRGIRAWLGYRQVGLEYNRHARFAGVSKYNFRSLVSLAHDGMFSFSKKPLILATRFGGVVTAAAFIFIIFTIIRKIFLDVEPQGWTSMMIVVLFLGGLQLLVLGVLGEYVGRIFDESKGRPTYVVSSTNNMNES